MRIKLHKHSNDRHTLTVVWPDGRSERMACETRSYLLHDLLHYAVEAEARIDHGFWGSLASGRSLASMNDRAQQAAAAIAGTDPVASDDPELMIVEKVVGAMHGATKGVPAGDLFDGMQRYASASDRAWPAWVTEPFVERVVERMRHLRGHWAATPFGQTMELDWPAQDASLSG